MSFQFQEVQLKEGQYQVLQSWLEFQFQEVQLKAFKTENSNDNKCISIPRGAVKSSLIIFDVWT